MQLDPQDLAILRLLQEDALLTNREIGTRIFKSHSSVNDRIQRLKERGFIKKYTVVLDNEKINILYDKKDHGNFLLVRIDNCHGRTLSVQDKSEVKRLTFTWKEKSPLPLIKNGKVDFEIDNDRLYFRVNYDN